MGTVNEGYPVQNEYPLGNEFRNESTAQATVENILDLVAEAIITSENFDITGESLKTHQKTIRDGLLQQGRLSNDEKLAIFQKDIKANAEDFLGTDGQSENLLDKLNLFIDAGAQVGQISVIFTDTEDGYHLIGLSSPSFDIPLQDITFLISSPYTDDDGNVKYDSLNVSQFVNISKTASEINIPKAEEYLDTNIYELMPDIITRQERINSAIAELNNLLPPIISNLDWGYAADGSGNILRDIHTGEWVGSEQYYLDNSISAPQNGAPGADNEEDGFITRLTKNESSLNENKSLESLRNNLNMYLKDIDEIAVNPVDLRMEYQNESNGYLKFRNLNQGIIIRNANQEFVEGLDPNNLTYLNDPNRLDGNGDEILGTGFTITMWVRFLDKTSEGTLFNFGSPMRAENENPFGFSLETYVINGDDSPQNTDGEFVEGFGSYGGQTWKDIFKDYPADSNNGNGGFLDADWHWEEGRVAPNEGFFSNTPSERFVRLVVRENDGRLRGSHTGMPFMSKRSGLPHIPSTSGPPMGGYDYFTEGVSNNANYPDTSSGIIQYDHMYGLMTNTRVPVDLTEWYFICASYNPNKIEPDFHNDMISAPPHYNDYKYDKLFWMNHKDPIQSGQEIANSDYGNKCKVEIISRSDLLRARGFKV